MSQDWSFETRAVHAGQAPDSDAGARALPIYQTTSFVFPDAQTAADRFALSDLGPIYTRIGNPILAVALVEHRLQPGGSTRVLVVERKERDPGTMETLDTALSAGGE